MGFTPGMGMTCLLEHVLSPAMAHEALYTGELRLGRDFEGRSGVGHVVARAEVPGRALDLARRIADKSRDALVLLKATLAAPRRAAFAAAREAESRMHAVTFARPETLARIDADYLEEG
jgi:polyketide biosynthesis enoyl-CoA hydratase PksI